MTAQNITCQLAHDVDFSLMKFPLWGFWKIDGVRAAAPSGRGFVGRSMDPFKNTALNARFADPVYAGFDGELTIHGWLSAAQIPEAYDPKDPNPTLCGLTTGLVNRAKIKKGETQLPDSAVWNVFDWLHTDVVDLEYGQRYERLAQAIETYRPANVRLLPYTVINNEAEAHAFIDACLDGTAPGLPGPCEGAIFRDPKAKHKSGRPGKRDNDFWRHKPVSDKDAYVVGVEEAQENGNEAKTNSLGRTERSSSKAGKTGNGMVGVLICRDFETGALIRVGPGAMKHDFRIKAFQDPSMIVGHPIKYTSLDTGVKDAPRQARFAELRSLTDLLPKQLAMIAQWVPEAA